MIKMLALKDVPSSIGAIPAGSIFMEPYDEQAALLERTGHAKRLPVVDRPVWDHHDWDGMTIVIIASGPSLTVEQCDLVRKWRSTGNDRRVLVVNTSYRRVPFADILYACDRRWWDIHRQEVARTFQPHQLWTQLEGGTPLVNAVRSMRGHGLSKVRGVIHQGANSGYQAIGLAVMWGAKKLILLGFDCHGEHWHGDHPSPLNARMPFELWKQAFNALAPDLAAAGVDVINCSPKSAIKAFPQQSLEEVLCLPSAPSVNNHITGAKPSSMDSDARATTSPKRETLHLKKTSSSSGIATE